jgi:hypothetical protein
VKRGWILLLLLQAAATAQAADNSTGNQATSAKASVSPSDDRSPFDKHPECMDRSVDASSGNCIIQNAGSPRHRYPPKPHAASKPVAAPSSTKGTSTASRSSQ